MAISDMAISSELPMCELKRQCERHGLASHGNKQQVWETLKNHLGLDDSADSCDTAGRMISSRLTLRSLRAHCKRRGLKVRGDKQQVWARLRDHLGLEEEEEEEGEEEEDEDFEDDRCEGGLTDHPAIEEEAEEDRDFEADPCESEGEQPMLAVNLGRKPLVETPHVVSKNNKLTSLASFVIQGNTKRRIVLPDRYSPSPSYIEDDDDSDSKDISLDSSTRNMKTDSEPDDVIELSD